MGSKMSNNLKMIKMNKAKFEQALFLSIYKTKSEKVGDINNPHSLNAIGDVVDNVTKFVEYRFGWFTNSEMTKFNPEKAKVFMNRLAECKINWPATKTELTDTFTSITSLGRNEAWEFVNALIDNAFLLEQPKSEFLKGQHFPKFYLNKNRMKESD